MNHKREEKKRKEKLAVEPHHTRVERSKLELEMEQGSQAGEQTNYKEEK